MMFVEIDSVSGRGECCCWYPVEEKLFYRQSGVDGREEIMTRDSSTNVNQMYRTEEARSAFVGRSSWVTLFRRCVYLPEKCEFGRFFRLPSSVFLNVESHRHIVVVHRRQQACIYDQTSAPLFSIISLFRMSIIRQSLSHQISSLVRQYHGSSYLVIELHLFAAKFQKDPGHPYVRGWSKSMYDDS